MIGSFFLFCTTNRRDSVVAALGACSCKETIYSMVLRLALVTAGLPTTGYGITINDDWFVASGGDLSNIPGTLDAGFAKSSAYSYQEPFLAVGNIGGCTATWIGNNPSGDISYILTAAHCGNYSQGENTPANATFTDWSGKVIASGKGWFHVPPQRINIPPGFGGASTDIGIFSTPRIADIIGHDGLPIQPPILYDQEDELNREVSLVGYGSWGIGSTGSNGSWWPSSGPRRAAATNTINGIWERDHGIGTQFEPPEDPRATELEGSIAPGDSGSAWWQKHSDVWTIIATTNGGSHNRYWGSNTAARMTKYVSWVKSVFPHARTFSKSVRVDP
jgi:hypothetical protein